MSDNLKEILSLEELTDSLFMLYVMQPVKQINSSGFLTPSEPFYSIISVITVVEACNVYGKG